TQGKVTHLVVAAGTGGTVVGTGKYLKEQNSAVQVWAIDAYGSLLKKWFDAGELDPQEVYPYVSEGFGEDFLPKNYIREAIDHFEKVSDRDGAVMTRRLAREEGIFAGYSAGSVVAGLMQLKDRLKPGDFVVLVFHDHGGRCEGKVYNDSWMMDRGWLDMETVKDLLAGLGPRRLITLGLGDPISKALDFMKKYDVEQIPVMEEGKTVGTVTQHGLFHRMMEDPDW